MRGNVHGRPALCCLSADPPVLTVSRQRPVPSFLGAVCHQFPVSWSGDLGAWFPSQPTCLFGKKPVGGAVYLVWVPGLISRPRSSGRGLREEAPGQSLLGGSLGVVRACRAPGTVRVGLGGAASDLSHLHQLVSLGNAAKPLLLPLKFHTKLLRSPPSSLVTRGSF